MKILFSFCAALMLTTSAMAYTLHFNNTNKDYNIVIQPVSSAGVYSPDTDEGFTLGPGEQKTVEFKITDANNVFFQFNVFELADLEQPDHKITIAKPQIATDGHSSVLFGHDNPSDNDTHVRCHLWESAKSWNLSCE